MLANGGPTAQRADCAQNKVFIACPKTMLRPQSRIARVLIGRWPSCLRGFSARGLLASLGYSSPRDGYSHLPRAKSAVLDCGLFDGITLAVGERPQPEFRFNRVLRGVDVEVFDFLHVFALRNRACAADAEGNHKHGAESLLGTSFQNPWAILIPPLRFASSLSQNAIPIRDRICLHESLLRQHLFRGHRYKNAA